jgi:CheY-like chemotaxis protein
VGSTVSANIDESRLRGREAILLVEDDPDIRDFVARTLLGLGYTVREAADGKSALESLETDAPVELLLSDMTMPGGISGRDLVIEARRRRPDPQNPLHVRLFRSGGGGFDAVGVLAAGKTVPEARSGASGALDAGSARRVGRIGARLGLDGKPEPDDERDRHWMRKALDVGPTRGGGRGSAGRRGAGAGR